MGLLINVLLLLVDANETLLASLHTLALTVSGSKGEQGMDRAGFLQVLSFCLKISAASPSRVRSR